MRRRLTGKNAATGVLFALIGTGILSNSVSAQTSAKRKTSLETAPLVWTDVTGRGYGPTYLKASPATIFIFFSTQCPLANAYIPRLRQMEQTYFGRKVGFFLVNAHPLDTPQKARRWVQDRRLLTPVVKDSGAALADRLGATVTPEAIIVGRAGEILYRGRIDDNKDPALVRKRDLTEALEAILSGKPVVKPVVRASGCLIVLPKALVPARKPTVTYARHVAPILNRACVECHRPSDVAPFSLTSYREARVWARQILDVTKRRIMPPWKPLTGYGQFHNARNLTSQEIATLAKWIDEGTPAGDLKQAPSASVRSAKWPQGRPDLIVSARRPYPVAAEGRDEYRIFVLPLDFQEDAYVTLAQIRPGARAVVHHVILYIDLTGKSLELDGKEIEEGFPNPNAGTGPPGPGMTFLTGWAPGNTACPLPSGTAVKIPKGAKIIMEVHYHRNLQPEVDHTQVGLTFARSAVQKQFQVMALAQGTLPLEPNQGRIQVAAHLTLDRAITLHSISPHMHRIGREMHVWATTPQGERIELIWLDDWDFNWQENYQYVKPLTLPQGTQMDLVATYDNSVSNLRNPNRPPRRIGWGEQTTDEMCIAFLGLTEDAEQLNAQPVPWQQAVVRSPDVRSLRTARRNLP